MKKILIPLTCLIFWVLLIGSWSSGFSSFTIFSHTLKNAGELPRSFPDLQLINQNGTVFSLQDDQHYKLVNFVYLSCPLVCHKVNNQLEEIYRQLDPKLLGDKLTMLTISFDLDRDNVEKINIYRSYFEGEGDISHWDFAVPYKINQEDFDKFLLDLGVWKYTNPETLVTNHSIYLFLISPENEIIRVFDPARSTAEQLTHHLQQCLE